MLLSCASLKQEPWTSPLPTLILLQKAKTSNEINQIHARLITTGLIKDTSLTTNIILSLSPSPHAPLVHFARHVFFTHHAFGFNTADDLFDPFLWNAIIKSYSHGKDPGGGLGVFRLMLESGVLVDGFSLSLVLKACSRMGLVREGIQLHGFLRKLEIGSDLFIQNCLIGFYVRCGCFELARQVFDRMSRRDSVSYNSMIDGYVKIGRIELAREMFDVMPVEERNVTSWNALISGYVKLEGGLTIAWELFEKMPERDLISWNLMIDGFAKCGRLEDARVLFDVMPERDVVSWASIIDGYVKLDRVDIARSLFDRIPKRDVIVCNAMMGGYVQNGHFVEALEILHGMRHDANLSPDATTFIIALSAVAQSGRIDEGARIHCYLEDNSFSLEEKLGVALIHMYSKCGSIERALKVFESINKKSVDHFNAMIGGLAIHGLGKLAFDLLIEMKSMFLKPDDITFIGLLNACGHAGLVKEGMMCFELMQRVHNMEPKLQHYGCMVDILCRAGLVEEARKFVEEMPVEPNDIILRTILGACQNHENISIGEPVAEHLLQLESCGSSSFVLLSNMYATLGKWKEVNKVRSVMKKRNLKKIPGYSWMEVEGNIHEFFVQDKSHPGVNEVYTLLDSTQLSSCSDVRCCV